MKILYILGPSFIGVKVVQDQQKGGKLLISGLDFHMKGPQIKESLTIFS